MKKIFPGACGSAMTFEETTTATCKKKMDMLLRFSSEKEYEIVTEILS